MRPATATIPIYEIFFLEYRQGLEPNDYSIEKKIGGKFGYIANYTTQDKRI
jgi:hypothetical protein